MDSLVESVASLEEVGREELWGGAGGTWGKDEVRLGFAELENVLMRRAE